MILPIKVGDTITIKEADYYFGSGDLTLRITGLPADQLPGGSDWIQITGVEIAWNGQEIGERTADLPPPDRLRAVRVQSALP